MIDLFDSLKLPPALRLGANDLLCAPMEIFDANNHIVSSIVLVTSSLS